MATSATRETIKELARWVLSIDARRLSPAALQQTKLLILDTLGCALAAGREKAAKAAVDLVVSFGGASQSTVIGTSTKTAIANAVLANGVLARYLDLNDFWIDRKEGSAPGIGGHPSDNIPVALAVAEARRRSGRDAIAAIVTGYEIYDRLRKITAPGLPWDRSTVSGLVAAAMAGRLLDLDETRMAHGLALGAARTVTPGIVRQGTVSASKFLANALVAQSGVLGALMAEKDLTGPLAILDHEKGLSSLYRGQDASPLIEPVTGEFAILNANMKAYPCLATGQAIVAAGCEIHRRLKDSLEAIETVEVAMAVNPFLQGQQADPALKNPTTRESADHSFFFLAAVGIIDGSLTPQSFDGERWMDSRVRNIMGKIVMSADATLNAKAPDGYPCSITVKTRDGRQHKAEIAYTPGYSQGGGIKASDVHTKFDAITERVLTASRRDALKAAVGSFEDLPSIDEVMRLAGSG